MRCSGLKVLLSVESRGGFYRALFKILVTTIELDLKLHVLPVHFLWLLLIDLIVERNG